ncbi:MAG TPA: VTT domain-containing protein [Thermoanaerobaculia bacterium]|nr:VTT domain-containing protein [Thermoanaerobaculia bacterium]
MTVGPRGGSTLAGIAALAGGSPLATATALALATLVSEDLACVAAGLLVASGRLSFAVATAACLVGIFVGDLLLVAAGRWLGRPVVERPPLSWLVSPAALERGSRWFTERGLVVVALSRFVPGSRLPLFVAAGVLHAPFLRIALALLLAGGVWTPMLVGLSALTGGAILSRLEELERWALPVAAAVALLVLLVVRVVVPAFTWRGRRLLVSRWRRLTRWEFWPLAVFQAPVVLNWLWLGLRFRAPTLFTAANPGIPAGGFVLESKSAILDAVGDREAVPAHVLLDLPDEPDARRAAVRAAHERLGGRFPVVGKPDVGERGEGVRILRDAAGLEAWALDADPRSLLQEFVAGEELGIFWVRRPDEPAGRVFSITRKELTSVRGDGRSSLEQLILRDDRAVCQAPIHLERHLEQLDRVPAAGEVVPLVEVGNHCRGALFRDGRELGTEALARRVDEIARSLPGFYFGRLDLRAPSLAHVRAGRDLRVLEVNGVTSEATHVYEPGASLLAAWRTLFEQWRIAFEIGRENVRRGAEPARLRELVALLAESRRRSGRIAHRTSAVPH